MRYDPRTRTLIDTSVAARVTDARLAKLARQKGKTTEAGEPIEAVVMFFPRPGHAEKNLDACKRAGVGCSGFDAQGLERVLFAGPRTTTVGTRPEGPLVPVLREPAWPHLSETVHRRLLGGPNETGPWVTYGWDAPRTIARMRPTDRGERSFEALDREALATLRGWRDAIQYREVDGHTVIVSHDYGAEMILVPEIMQDLAARLRTDLLVVGVPTERSLFAASGLDPERVAGMVRWARDEFGRTQKRRVSPIPFLVDASGRLVGQVTTAPAGARADRPWWKFW